MEYNDEIAMVQTLSARAGLSAYLKFIVQFLIVHVQDEVLVVDGSWIEAKKQMIASSTLGD